MFFFLLSEVWGRTHSPALFVLLFVWTNQRSLWRMHVACCVHNCVSRESRSGPFLFYGSRSNTHSSLRISSVDGRPAAHALMMKSDEPRRGVNRDNVLVSPATYRPCFLVFSPRCVFPFPLPHSISPCLEMFAMVCDFFFAAKRERIIERGKISISSLQRAANLLSGRRLCAALMLMRRTLGS